MTTYSWAVVLIALTTGLNPLLRLHAVPLAHLTAFQDDFFFYLTIARNLANSGASTFDFLGRTNGYHPLWIGVLTVIAKFVDAGSVWFVVLLETGTFVLVLVTAALFDAIARMSFPGRPGARWTGGLFVVFLYANLTRTGMEVILAVPAMLASILATLRLVRGPSTRGAFVTAVLYTVTILSRLDSVILVLALSVAVALCERRSRVRNLGRFLVRPRTVLVTALGSAPLLVYFLVNLVAFGMLMPQSGVAKQLMTSFAFNPRVLEFLFKPKGNLRDLVFFSLTGTLPLCLGLTSFTLALSRIRRLGRPARVVLVGSNLGVVLFYTTLSFLSSWSLWIWYLYPIVIAGGAGATSLLGMIPRGVSLVGARHRLSQAGVAIVAFSLVLLTMAAAATRDPRTNMIHWTALRLAEFAHDHPGTYAMGDRSGLLGFLLPRGLVQLEGLVSDRSLLDLIRAEAPLEAAFERFRVTYYVTTELAKRGNCYLAEEPKVRQAGTNAKRMTALLCTPPVATITDPKGGVTLIFRVS